MKLGGLRYTRKPLWASIIGALLTIAVMVNLLMVLIHSFAYVPPAHAQFGAYWTWNGTYTENGTPISSEIWNATYDYDEWVGGNYCRHTSVTTDPDALRYTGGVSVVVTDSESWIDHNTSWTVKLVSQIVYSGMDMEGVFTYSYYDVTPTSWTYVINEKYYLGASVVAEANSTYEVTVLGNESISVPAGTFNCSKLFHNVTLVRPIYPTLEDPAPPDRPTNRTQWLSALVGTDVRMNNTAYDGVETWELTDYGIAARPVGGTWIPVDKLALLAPYIALTSTIIIAATAAGVFFKYRKKP